MIGIFDSGVGGLSVFREIRKLLPEEKYIYFSDSAHCPYGEKSREYIINRSREISTFLMERGARVIVVACNTATAAAIETLRNEFPIHFIGMEPAVKPAVRCTSTGVVGVLATAGTLKAEKYMDTRSRWAQDVTIVEHIGKGFVELVEKGMLTGPVAESAIRESLSPLLEAGADTIVLGCTHYPFLTETIRKTASVLVPEREVKIIDPAPAVARHLLEVIQEEGLTGEDQGGFSIELHSSGDPATLMELYDRLTSVG